MRVATVALMVLSSLPVFAQSPSRSRLVTTSPSPAGQPVTMTAEVDSLGGGAPRGDVSFADGARVLGSAPLFVPGAGQATLTAGWTHSCSLTSTGGVKCWGDNAYGQLGDGTKTKRKTPVWVGGFTTGIVAVAAGRYHTCALNAVGGVLCWGDNRYGQLGDATRVAKTVPTEVAGLSSGAVAIVAGAEHSCALTTDGGVKCWGRNYVGQLGDGTTGDSLTPTAISSPATYTALAAGWNHTCALTSGGAVQCWGWSIYGQLGNGATEPESYSLPVTVIGLSSGVVAVTANGLHSCAITVAGALKCWGSNIYGQIGDGTANNTRSTPTQVSGLTSGVVTAAAGRDHTCALLLNGAVRCWGDNSKAQLGDGTIARRLTPWPVGNLTGFAVAISSGAGHSCALLSPTRIVKCWGNNQYGQIGDGTSSSRFFAIPVSNFWGILRGRAQSTAQTLGAGWHFLQVAFPGGEGHSPSSSITPHRLQPAE